MSIFKNAVKKPITTMMVFTAIIVMGLYSLIHIPIDLLPEIEPPFVSVMTTYPGANASDVESNITRPLEDAFNSVDKLKQISSVSSDNLSIISLEFNWGTDLNEASNEIRETIDMVFDNLPDGIRRPAMFKFNMSSMPIVFYAITARESYPGLEKILEEKIINPLNRIEGIGSVSLIGTPQRKIYVEVDPIKLDAYSLSIEQIGEVIRAENMNMPSGNILMGPMDYLFRVQGEIKESSELANLVVGNHQGTSVYLSDVAQIRDAIKDVTLDERIDGESGVRMFVMKQSGANTVQIAKDVRKALAELEKDLPADVSIKEIVDSSLFISDSISNLSQTILWALLFVVLVVLFFLGKWRATFIVMLTIPISLIVSFIYLYITGGSLNIISLASISIALGMVVDDAIVVLENISRHIERGASPREAAIFATNEVWLSVIVTTLVIVAVFFPLTLVGGLTGVLFNQLGWIVSITVIVSTLAAVTLTPMLSSVLLRLNSKISIPSRFSHARIIEPFLRRMENLFEYILQVALHNKKKVLITALAIFVGSLFLVRFLSMEFMPETDEGQLSATIELTSGLRVEETVKIARHIEDLVNKKYPEVELMSVSSGSDSDGGIMALFSETASNMINISMRLSAASQRERDVWVMADALRKDFDLIPEIAHYSVSTSDGASGSSGSSTVDIEIYGYDFNTTSRLAHQLKDEIAALPGATEVQVSRKDERPELQLILDKKKMAGHGLNTAMVSMALRNRLTGMTASQLREEGDEYDIIIRYKEEFRNSLSDVEAFTITNPMGVKVRLSEIGEIKEYFNPPNIERKRRERVITVSAVPAGISLGDLAGEIQKIVSATEIPQGVMVNVGGDYAEMMDSFMDLGLLILISLILVFLVMASQFESFVMPFVIMFSIPFSFTGVILALLITNTTLSIIAGLGAVLLIGIVVKNGIVLIDYINLLRDRGHALNEAIIQAGKNRLRPVLMTALTTILAMLPMAISTGEGSEIWSPMGITLIGGLIFSTLVTLVLIPVVYGIVSRRGERDKMREVREKFTFLQEV
ncbi:MAG: efflux RND transporter permease subunit [Bacteroidetes bacterium]|nr:MAG: efflux RND transporter permease subunit [Bacteroidota bacterium]